MESRRPPGSPIHSNDGQATAACAREYDWSAHPLGPLEMWTVELRTVLSLLFNTRQPMCLFWGERDWYFYNDGYLPIVSAAKHPWAMGRPGAEVWAEAWPLLLPQIEQVRRGGGATWNVDQLIPVLRDGALVDAYFTYSYSPVFLEDGTVGGTLVTCTETTTRLKTERDLRSKTEALEHSLNAFDIVDAQGRFVYANRAYLDMWGYSSLEEIVGTSPSTHCADPETPARIIGALKESGECELEFVALRKDGTTFDVRMFARVAHDAEGREIYPTTSIDITDVKQAQVRLRESEERLRLALGAASMGVYERDLANDEVIWSDQARNILGSGSGSGSASPATFAEFRERMHPEDRDRFEREALAAAREGRSVDISYRYRRRDGETRWLHAYGKGLTDPSGRVTRAIGVLQDITERTIAESRVRASERKFATLFHAAPFAAALARVPGGELVDINPAFETLFEYTREEAIGAATLAELTRRTGEIEVRTKSGRALTVENHVNPVELDGVSHALITLQDVTAQRRAELETKHAEQRLRESEARFREIADSMPQIVWTADAAGRTTFLNARWFEYTGAPRNSASLGDFGTGVYIHPDDADRVQTAWEASGQQQQQFEVELRLRHHSGAYRWHISRSVPIVASGGVVRAWYGTSTDVDAQVKAKADLERAVRARDEFLSIASHELKTPLTALSLQTESAKRAVRSTGGPLPVDRLVKLVDQTERQTNRLVRLVDDMLDVARIDTGKLTMRKTRVDLCEVVGETVERLRPQFEANETPLTVAGCEPLFLDADRERIEQVFLNLLTNALRYGRGQPVRVEVSRAGDRALCTVRDQGSGIAADHHARVFGRFERAVSASDVSGLGLGLYISRQIVESHGGTITVESAPDVGSTFTIELPLVGESPLPA